MKLPKQSKSYSKQSKAKQSNENERLKALLQSVPGRR